MHKTLIFDFDGTIADTLAFTVNSALEINRSLKLLSAEKVDMEKFRSMDSEEFFKKLQISNLKLLYFVFKYQKKLGKEINNVKAFSGLSEVFNLLKEQGVKMGIATSNSTKNVKKFLKNNDLNYFDFIYSSINYFQKNKMLDKAVKKYGLNKDSVIYIGDEVRDIKAAKSADIKVASVTWGYNLEPVLTLNKPDYIVSQPKDLLNLIN